jgi:SH3-like domain-containing protein
MAATDGGAVGAGAYEAPSPKRAAKVSLTSASAAAATVAAEVDREVRGSLDELKDSLFRLELRRQAGTVSEEDYARERERIDATLRNLVRG